MDTLEAIRTRHSIAPTFLIEPGPDGEALRQILDAGAAAPDHGRLRPWRFVVVRGAARGRLGQVFADALLARDPAAPPAALEQERRRPDRAPVVIAVCGMLDPDHPKIPGREQILSTGAAVQNMLLAAHALGFGGKWLTGANAYDDRVKRALGLDPDHVVAGFLHLGTADGEPPVVPHARADEHSFEWEGEGRLSPLR